MDGEADDDECEIVRDFEDVILRVLERVENRNDDCM